MNRSVPKRRGLCHVLLDKHFRSLSSVGTWSIFQADYVPIHKHHRVCTAFICVTFQRPRFVRVIAEVDVCARQRKATARFNVGVPARAKTIKIAGECVLGDTVVLFLVAALSHATVGLGVKSFSLWEKMCSLVSASVRRKRDAANRFIRTVYLSLPKSVR